MKLYIIIASFLFAQISIGQETPKDVSSNVWSLEDCINYAIAHNISVKDASLNTNLAEVDYSKAKSSRLPDLFGSASQSFSNGNTIDPITSSYVTDQIHSTNVGINSSVTLFKGNQISNQIKQNKILLEQSIFLEEEAKNSIVISLLENYLQALFSKEDIAIAESNLEASKTEVLRAKARLDAGTIALSDYTEAQSQVATNQYNLIAAKNNYQQYIIDLKQLLELTPMDDLEIESIDENMDLINLELDRISIYNNALNYLPEIEASKLNVAAKEKELDIAKGGYSPTLSLSGSVGSGYTSINDNTFSDQFDVNFNQKLGLSLTIPIFNRNATKSAVQSATINIEKAEIQKQITEKILYKKVETAYQNALSAQEQIIAAEASKEASEQSYKLAQKKYELGDLSTTDLVISQNTYTNAQQNYLQAKYLNILYHQLLQFYQGNDIKL
ncbi:TolC family protein [Algibacter lectus]|uniref:RND efflux system outer membrane lipoprotein CmeC n=1 Tax=Algibacter lectus TaxID=221126 RepID=A0A090WR24_9FLAO|nr:TolC family protein [Algibacter lectus]MDO7136294.1 TolC family protein [Algibacter lectus]GAL77839.1 RND efflux system outer membrane lipoprotein CmeC [Algibacter lectus]